MAGSTLELYRALLAAPSRAALGTGSLTWVEGYAGDVVALTNGSSLRDRVLVVANLGAEPVALPEGAEVIVASAAARGRPRADRRDGLGPLVLMS